ncbi:MAG TPA: metallopeptidase TldD-related protein [Bryobacteraceae bacterium]|nr:metallopeptidase TldD-related protein [Bryobacteraceae bacterium]
MRYAAAIALLAASSAMAQKAPVNDVLLRAMQDELERSRKLSLTDLDKPYFIEYTLDDVSIVSASASLGAVLGKGESRFRVPRVRLRVGDYAFDNSNYLLSDFIGGSRFDSDTMPLDDNYGLLRRGWWLSTDRAFKGAVEAIGRKRAALKNMTQPEALADFWKSPPSQKIEARAERVTGAAEVWATRVRNWSAIFTKYPEVVQSGVSYNGSQGTFYMTNSEGSVLRRPEPLANLQVQAFAFAPDGTIVRDALSLPRNEETHLPAAPEIDKLVEAVAVNVKALAAAPAADNYAGPVLFEGIAGPQVMAELLAPNVVLGRRPIGEPGRAVPFLPSEFEGRLESRILPEFLDVIDDPVRSEWNGQQLLGHYEVDEEGVTPKPVVLIEKGRLKSFLLTRQPVPGFQGSNGRARLPGAFGSKAAAITNLFIQSSESVPAAELKARFLKLVATRNKPWGIIIRKMDYPSSASSEEVRRLAIAANQSGSPRIISAPLLAYKVTPDGKEQLIRGLRFRGLSVRALRDIVAVSQEQQALHYLYSLAPMALMGSGGYVAPVSVIGPSVLFDELELERPRDDVPNLPLVPAPALTTQTASAR